MSGKHPINRRRFNGGLLTAGAAAMAPGLGATPLLGQDVQPESNAYGGPNVIVVRFGGGVRRRETIDPEDTYSPYLRHVLAKRGTLFTDMRIASQPGVVTSHAQGTLYLLTGRYDTYSDIEGKFLSERFEPKAPTLFEYLRKTFDIPAHQALIVNGEDRVNEDYLSFSNTHSYGVDFRSSVLSLHWFKIFVLRRQIESGTFDGKALEDLKSALGKLEARNYRGEAVGEQVSELKSFWNRWRLHYGDNGFKNPRGDRLLTELSVRALRELRPKLLMVNYQDPDYVHWGNLSHYTRAISIIDQGIKQLVETVDADPEYRDNTVFVIVPDCGRDNNPLMQISCQHHFNSRSAHEIWALVAGPGIAQGQVVDKTVQQVDVAATVARVMGFSAEKAEGGVLADAFL